MNTTVEARLKNLSNQIVEACLNAADLFQNGTSMNMHSVHGDGQQEDQPSLIASYTLRHYLDLAGPTTVEFSSYVTLSQGWSSARVKIVTDDTKYFFVASLNPNTNLWSGQVANEKYQLPKTA